MSYFFFFQAEDGIRDLVRSRGLGDVYKRQVLLRIEDHDAERSRPEYETQLLDDLDWLGFVPDLSLIHI